VSAHYGKQYSLQYLRERSYITREGVSLLGISEAAENIGFRTQGYKVSWKQLRDQIPLPAIVHWNQNHFVVLYEIKEKKKGLLKSRNPNEASECITIADPARGIFKLNRQEFLKSWSVKGETKQQEGVVLTLEPTPAFYRKEDSPKTKLTPGYLLRYLQPYRKYIVQLMLSILAGSLLSLVFPFLTRAVVDYGIGNKDTTFVLLILIAQLVLIFGQTANGMIRSWINLHVTTRVSISLITDFLAKLMRLPMAFFDTKKTGDIMQRIQDHRRIQTFITGSLIDIVFSLVTLVMYAVVMAGYHPGILGIFVAGSTLYVFWVISFLKRRRELDYKRFQQSSANQSNIVQLVAGMQEIKLNGCEKQKRWEWERIQAKLYKVSVKSLMLSQHQQLGATLINQVKDILITFIAARAVIQGEMTLGMMMAVQYIIGQLNAPVAQFIHFAQASQDAHISIERLGEIHHREDEDLPGKKLIAEIPPKAQLEVRNLSFSYEGPHAPMVLDDISLTVPAQKTTAIVGVSGSGKTSLIKMMLGFYEPHKGSVNLNGQAITDYKLSAWRKQVGVVMQEGYIFSDTIENNIGIIDNKPVRERVKHAAEMANITDYINSLPLGYQTKIGAEGHGLSTGQKQRLLIARAIYKEPSYIFFDEATNALDASNESVIISNLKQFFNGRTVVIVAHRLSTVKHADQIVVLEKGKISETGNHQQLIENRGIYYHLVKDQLELGN
jgi:ATP-binding cassette subfamily B protein